MVFDGPFWLVTSQHGRRILCSCVGGGLAKAIVTPVVDSWSMGAVAIVPGIEWQRR